MHVSLNPVNLRSSKTAGFLGSSPANHLAHNESKEPDAFLHQALFSLAHHRDVGRLGSLGTLFNIEFDLLSLLKVTETVALNGGEMDENVLSAFTLDKAEAFVTIEPLDCTIYTFRHCFCLLWQFDKILGVLFGSIGGAKQNNPRIK